MIVRLDECYFFKECQRNIFQKTKLLKEVHQTKQNKKTNKIATQLSFKSTSAATSEQLWLLVKILLFSFKFIKTQFLL